MNLGRFVSLRSRDPGPDHTCSHLLYVALMTGNSVDQLVNATVAAQNLFRNEKYFCEGIQSGTVEWIPVRLKVRWEERPRTDRRRRYLLHPAGEQFTRPPIS